jgi:hypothetical protein
MLTDSCGLMLLALLCLVWLAWTWSHRPSFPSQSAAVTARVQRLLKPPTPDDCPRCHQQATAATPPARRPVTPWRDHKSRRGAPKRIATQGFACPNHMCAYYRITDAQIHALVGDGAHGQCERRETLRCQAWVLLSDMVDNSDLPFARELYPFSDGFSTGDIPMPGHTTDTRPSQAPMSARGPPSIDGG